MDGRWRVLLIEVVFVSLIFGQSPLMALPFGQAIENVADRLEAEQIKYGVSAGIWPEEADFTGSIVAGMLSAYDWTCNSAYKYSAELGGDYILWAAAGNFYGDEAFALTGLSEISSDPGSNIWRTALSDYYYSVEQDINGTEGYISQFAGTEPSTAVFYLANHTVAAYYADANDKQLWRGGLVDYLAETDNTSKFPVMALGVATWALVQTGPLDATLIDPSGTGAAYWSLKKLSDLPGLVLSHQVPPGEPNEGSFYWRFDHGTDGLDTYASGYTEDAIFATLGLIAASEADPGLDADAAILAARQALLNGISQEGKVWERLSQKGWVYYTYAGEMLQVLGDLVIPGDLNLDGGVDFVDYAIFANNWPASGCTECSWCNGADIDQNGTVDFNDLKIMLDNWLKGKSP